MVPQRTAVLFAVASVVTLLYGTFALAQDYDRDYRARLHAQVADDAAVRGVALERAAERRLEPVGALVAFARQAPEPTEAAFFDFADQLLRQRGGARALELAPAGVVRFVYPLAGNEVVEGHDLRADPTLAPALDRAADGGHTVLAGPDPLRQGGWGVTAVAPVFVEGDSGTDLWGYALVVLDLDPLLAEAGLLGMASHRYALRGEGGSVFMGHEAVFRDGMSVAVPVPGGEWTLAAVPAAGWPAHAPARALIWTGGSLLAGFSGLLWFVAVLAVGQRRSALSALRESETRYRTVFETSPVGIVLQSADGVILRASPAFSAMLGYEPGALVGREEREFLHPDDRRDEAQAERERAAFSPWAAAPAGERRYVARDGAVHWADVAVATVPAPDGEPLYAICMVQDVTQRRLAEATLREAEDRRRAMDRLLEMDRFRTRFLSNVSHELNTPLTPMRLQLHMLKGQRYGALNEDQRRAVALLDRNLDRLMALVGDLLDVSRMRTGQLPLVRTRFDLGALVRDTVTKHAAAAERESIGLETTIRSELPVHADEERLGQAVAHLVSNAIKFTPPGGLVRIHAAAHGGEAVVEVEDTGVGLAPDEMARLFEPFGPRREGGRVGRPGTGSGLFLTRGILEQHGGRVWCSSRGPGRGATFSFALSLASPLGTRDDGGSEPQASQARRGALAATEPEPAAEAKA